MDRLENKVKECQIEGGKKKCTLGPKYHIHCPYNMCEGTVGKINIKTLYNHDKCWLYQNKKAN